jgi:ArsR family transcriptional regulator, arsenate/arsenite/antimonite-responsive transcriptional repressor
LSRQHFSCGCHQIDIFASFNLLNLTLTFKQFEKISKALGDSNRLKILHFLSNKGGCGQCSDIQSVVDLAQPSISHHVKILVEAGLIEPEKEGRNHKYTINNDMLGQYMSMISDLKT